MTVGKVMAQAGHAGMITAALLAGSDPAALHRWYRNGLPAVASSLRDQGWWGERAMAVGPQGWGRRKVAVRDAGFTEIDPGTVTVVADAASALTVPQTRVTPASLIAATARCPSPDSSSTNRVSSIGTVTS